MAPESPTAHSLFSEGLLFSIYMEVTSRNHLQAESVWPPRTSGQLLAHHVLHFCVSGQTKLPSPGSILVAAQHLVQLGPPENLFATLGRCRGSRTAFADTELPLGLQAMEGYILGRAVSPDGGSSGLRIAGCPVSERESPCWRKGAETSY